MTSDTSEKPRTFFETIKLSAEISVVLGAVFFFSGWNYLYGYYRVFGIRVTELNFSSQTILIYCWPVVRSVIFLSVFFSILVIAVAVHLLVKAHSWRRLVLIVSKPVSVTVVVLAIYAFCSWLGIRTGMNNAKSDAFLSTSTLPQVKIEGTADNQQAGCRIDAWNYLLLLRANGQVYVLEPIDNATSAPNLRICVFPESRIQATRIQVGLDGK